MPQSGSVSGQPSSWRLFSPAAALRRSQYVASVHDGNQTDDYSYTYDAASNRLTEDHNGTTGYTYNETNELSPVDDPGARARPATATTQTAT